MNKSTAFGVPWLLVFFCMNAHANWQPLWPDAAPGSPNPPVFKEQINQKGHYTDTGEPAYWYYPAASAEHNGAAVVIFPGGGYGILAMDHEGHEYAKWLNERGVAAVLVKYRVSSEDASGFHYPAPYLDARRAIRLTREKAAEWLVDPDKIGVMGSSAGGHLASMCMTLFDETYPAEASEPTVSSRPNFGILLYPVIGMDQPWGHGGSRRRLLGPENSDVLAERLATHRRVSEDTPPCFLIHAADDEAVPVRNSFEFARACAERGVASVLQVLPEGGHGFGLSIPGADNSWLNLLEAWLESKPWEGDAARKR